MNTLESSLDELFENEIQNESFPGAVVLVNYRGERIFHKAYGWRNRETDEPVEKDTVFDLASVTKIITSSLILKKVTEGKLQLNGMVGDLLTSLKNNEALASITIQSLLTHSSGLKAWEPFYTHSDKSVFNILDSMDVLHHEQHSVVYSDLNYILLGEILKELEGKSLQAIVLKELVEPLQLKKLSYKVAYTENVAATEYGNQIEMQMCNERNRTFDSWRIQDQPIIGKVNDGNAFYFFGGESGHAGLFGTAEDLEGLASIYLKGGLVGDKRLIDSRLIHASMEAIAGNRGLGWHSGDPFPAGVGHTGFTGTSLWLYPEKDLHVTLLTNRLHVADPKNINPVRKKVHEVIMQHIVYY
ncbi:serine hydrolase domain-containing protein [Thalassobacillus hwangdonensis]|uniref:Serine hydrolase domain-containing protein n=1 Tax=Thalassobacillus hwangdonensis TaxID=546108 RepID=A0ABW3KWV0_9BACI